MDGPVVVDPDVVDGPIVVDPDVVDGPVVVDPNVVDVSAVVDPDLMDVPVVVDTGVEVFMVAVNLAVEVVTSVVASGAVVCMEVDTPTLVDTSAPGAMGVGQVAGQAGQVAVVGSFVIDPGVVVDPAPFDIRLCAFSISASTY